MTFKNLNLIYNNGVQFAYDGQYENAIDCFDEILEIEKDNILALFSKAGCLSKLGEFNKVDENYSETIKICNEYPNDEDIQSIKLRSYMYLKEYDIAMDVCEELLSKFPENIDALLIKGKYLNDRFEFSDAMDCFNKVLKLYPNNLEANLYKADALLRLGLYDDCKEYLNIAFSFNPYHPYLWYLKADYECIVLNNYELAIKCYDKAIELSPYEEILYYKRGQCIIISGQYEEARANFKKLFDINPHALGIQDVEGFYKTIDLMEESKLGL